MSGAPDDLIGRQLGDFVVTERIGAGGFGLVYRAQQVSLRRDAVIKVLRHHLAGESSVVERFLREAALAARLEHPFAAHIYAFGSEADGLLWIGMEFVRGAPLDDLLRRGGPLSIDVFTPLFERICEVVASAHEQGIVHRDIKPANVMVMSRAGKRVPKLLDFGIATAFEANLERELEKERDTPQSPPPLEGALGDTMPVGVDTNRLTRDGAVIGSPPYMAPEQWLDSRAVDQAADIYALGVLAFEALHGKPPYAGSSLTELARAHLEDPPPAVSGDLPSALDEFFAAALAKERGDRPATAIALSELFASCAGVHDQPLALPPAIEEALSLFVRDGPQIIAEPCAALLSARNPHEALGLIDEITHEVARYAGILALAARTHTGPPAAGDSPAVAEVLRALRNHGLDAAAWINLACELVIAAEVHPLPELKKLLATDWPRRLLDTAAHQPRSKGADIRTSVDARLHGLASCLREIELLCDHMIAVPRADVAERWMGQRGRRIHTTPLGGLADVEPDLCYLVDLAGRPVVGLDPLLLVRPPSPGAEPELFAIAGTGGRGGLYVSRPDGYEIEDPRLWEWFREYGLVGDSGDRGSRDSGADPYPGLVAFTRADADRFFGREVETQGCLNRLRSQPALCVVGPSGAGKSSFVQAGLVAALPEHWRDVYLRPGKQPLDTLAHVITAAGGFLTADALREQPRIFGGELARLAVKHPVIVIIDQLEELFTLCADAGERECFATAIVAATAASTGIRVVTTLRDDFLIRAQSLLPWRGFFEPSLKLLATPAPADLRRALTEPARQLGYTWDDAELPDEIVEAVADEPNALALLAFAAHQLWERRDRGFHRLTRQAYDEMGGVAGAVARHAESVIEDMPADDRQLVRKLFRQLVTAEGTRAVLRRDELLELSGRPERAAGVLERLLASRLLHTGEGDDEGAVELAHEALLTTWPRLAEWLRLDAEGARLRDELRGTARQWNKRDRPDGLLWRGDALAELRAWVERHGDQLTSTESDFVAASNRAERQGRTRRRVVLAAVIAILLAAVSVLLLLNQQRQQAQRAAEGSAREATGLLVAGYEEQGRQAALRGDCMQALLFIEKALDLGSEAPEVRFLLARCAPSIEARKLTFRGHRGRLWDLSPMPDGRLVSAGADGTIILWDAKTGAEIRRFVGHESIVYRAAPSPDGTRIASASADKTARIWNADTGEVVAILRGQDTVFAAEFSPDGETVLTGSLDGHTQLWNSATGELVADLVKSRQPFAMGAAFSPDGRRLVVAAEGNHAQILDLASNQVIARLELAAAGQLTDAQFTADGSRFLTVNNLGAAQIWSADGQRIATLGGLEGGNKNTARFSPDGSRVIATDRDQTAVIWTADGARVATLRGHEGAINSVAFSADGRMAATGSMDGSARLWDAETGALLMVFTGHTGPVWEVLFESSGSRLVTASWDQTAQVWDTRPRQLLASRRAHDDAITAVRFIPGTNNVVTASADGHLRLWDSSGELSGEMIGHDGAVNDAAVDPRGGQIASAGADGTVRVWSIAGAAIRTLEGHAGAVLRCAYSPDGRQLATIGADGEIRVWDAATGALRTTLAGFGGDFAELQFSPDGSRLLEYGYPERTLVVWDVAARSKSVEYRGHRDGIVAGTFSPTGQLVASSSEDKTVHIWDSRTGRTSGEIAVRGGAPAKVVFSPGGDRILIAGDDAVIRVVDVESGEIVGRLAGHRAHIADVVYTSAGDLIISISFDYTARVWSARTLQPLAELEAHEAEITHLAISDDGRRLATGGRDGHMNVWDLGFDRRDHREIERLVRCEVPFALRDGLVVQSKLAPSDCD